MITWPFSTFIMLLSKIWRILNGVMTILSTIAVSNRRTTSDNSCAESWIGSTSRGHRRILLQKSTIWTSEKHFALDSSCRYEIKIVLHISYHVPKRWISKLAEKKRFFIGRPTFDKISSSFLHKTFLIWWFSVSSRIKASKKDEFEFFEALHSS